MNKIFTITLALAMATMLAACSSSPKTEMEKVVEAQIGSERVLSRMDEMSSRPKWVTEETPFKIEGGTVTSLGFAAIPSDHNLQAGYRIAENNSKAAIASAVSSRLEFIFQQAEESTTMGTNQVQFIGSETSRLTTNSMRLSRRYFEKVATTTEGGQVSVQYKIFVLTSMPESDFKVAITDAIRKNQGKLGISSEFAKKVDQQWENFVNANPTEQKQ